MGASIFTPDKGLSRAGAMAMMQGGKRVYGGRKGSFYGSAYDAAMGSGMAYIVGELEKVDPKLREPLTNVTWQRDIVAKTGGGWVEYTSAYDVDYGTSGANGKGIVGSGTTAIPMMQVDTSKTMYKVFTWMQGLQIPFIDQAKLKQIGRSLEDLLDKGVKLNYNKTLDENVYKGYKEIGTTGLLNDPNIVATSAAKGEGGKTTWRDKTPQEILNDINDAITETWKNSEYSLDGMANHVLIPPDQFSYIAQAMVNIAAGESILDYLMKNNIATKQGRSINIVPCRWCIKAGEGGTDRMMVYVNNEDKVNFDITVPITRAMTQPSIERAAYLTLYAAQIGQVKFYYYQPCLYVDGI